MMSLSPRTLSDKAGQAPGTVTHVGEPSTEPATVHILQYGPEQMRYEKGFQFSDNLLEPDWPVTWVHLDGVHDVDLVTSVGQHFNLHPLLLEDVVNTRQRAKVEEFDNCLFVVMKRLVYDEAAREIRRKQFSLVIGEGFVLSFAIGPNSVVEMVRQRVEEAKGRIRGFGADYLFYALLDAVVDSYLVLLDKLGDHIEDLEEELIEDPDEHMLQRIHDLKREMLFVRKAVWPLREAVAHLQRQDSVLITDTVTVYFRDVYDHIYQAIDTLMTYRDMLSGMLDTYLSSVSNRMNAVMSVLTIIATIFIPLTFIAGVYGMNFENMPELGWPWAYPAVWGLMILIAAIMLIFFRRKRWL